MIVLIADKQEHSEQVKSVRRMWADGDVSEDHVGAGSEDALIVIPTETMGTIRHVALESKRGGV